MKIVPEKNKIQIKAQEPKAGVLNTSSHTAAIEVSEVVAVGSDVKDYKRGDIILFKSWAVDIISHEGEKYYFIDQDTKGICGTIKK